MIINLDRPVAKSGCFVHRTSSHAKAGTVCGTLPGFRHRGRQVNILGNDLAVQSATCTSDCIALHETPLAFSRARCALPWPRFEGLGYWLASLQDANDGCADDMQRCFRATTSAQSKRSQRSRCRRPSRIRGRFERCRFRSPPTLRRRKQDCSANRWRPARSPTCSPPTPRRRKPRLDVLAYMHFVALAHGVTVAGVVTLLRRIVGRT